MLDIVRLEKLQRSGVKKITPICYRGFKGAPNMLRDTSLSYSRCKIFQSGEIEIKPKSDCINHFPIDLESKDIRFVPNLSENGK